MYFRDIMDFVLSSAEDFSEEDVPVVAAIAIENKIISSSFNEVEKHNIPWFHAEFLAIEKALKILNTRYLDNASLYVSLEPCAFCASVLEKVRIKEIFFGAYDPKCGAIFHNSKLFEHSLIKPHIIGGIQENRCSEILKKFFKDIRKK